MKKEKLREKSYQEKKIRGIKFLQKIDKNYKEIEKDIRFLDADEPKLHRYRNN